LLRVCAFLPLAPSRPELVSEPPFPSPFSGLFFYKRKRNLFVSRLFFFLRRFFASTPLAVSFVCTSRRGLPRGLLLSISFFLCYMPLLFFLSTSKGLPANVRRWRTYLPPVFSLSFPKRRTLPVKCKPYLTFFSDFPPIIFFPRFTCLSFFIPLQDSVLWRRRIGFHSFTREIGPSYPTFKKDSSQHSYVHQSLVAALFLLSRLLQRWHPSPPYLSFF